MTRQFTEEHKRRLSESHKGQVAWNRGRYETREEVLAKISAASKGRPSPMKGKKHTAASRRQMSESKRGTPAWNKGLKMDSWSEERRQQQKDALARPRPLNGSRSLQFSAAEHETLHELQGGKCAICSEVQRFHIDHDHATDEVRGLLCGNCNRALGSFRDRPDLMLKAVAYLANPPARQILID